MSPASRATSPSRLTRTSALPVHTQSRSSQSGTSSRRTTTRRSTTAWRSRASSSMGATSSTITSSATLDSTSSALERLQPMTAIGRWLRAVDDRCPTCLICQRITTVSFTTLTTVETSLVIHSHSPTHHKERFIVTQCGTCQPTEVIHNPFSSPVRRNGGGVSSKISSQETLHISCRNVTLFALYF